MGQIFQSSPEKIDPGESENEARIKKLLKKLSHFESTEQQRQEYFHQVSQMTENLKRDNYGLNVIIEKLRLESEREINAREIENNDLKKKLENILKNPSKVKKDRGKKVVLNYTELKNEPEISEEEISTLTHEELQKNLVRIYGVQSTVVDENFVLEIK